MMGFNNGGNQSNPHGSQFNQNDPVFNMFGGFQNFQTQFNNISRAANVQVFRNCCQTFGIKNNSTIPILAANFNVIFARPDLGKSY